MRAGKNRLWRPYTYDAPVAWRPYRKMRYARKILATPLAEWGVVRNTLPSITTYTIAGPIVFKFAVCLKTSQLLLLLSEVGCIYVTCARAHPVTISRARQCIRALPFIADQSTLQLTPVANMSNVEVYYVFYCWLIAWCYERSLDINPRADWVWRITRPDEGAQRAPPYLQK